MSLTINIHAVIRRLANAALWATALSLPQASGAPTTAGLMDWSFDHHDATVPVAIWYPASGPTAAINAGPFTLQAAEGEPRQQSHPLVIISHGTGGSSIAHHPLAEALAQAGYMVAAPTHPGDNYQDRSLVADARYFDERPRQIAALLTALSADTSLSALIDNTRIGAIGHSAGGYSIAVSIGGKPDRAALIEHCQSVADDPSCHYKDPTIGVSASTDKPFSLPENFDSASPTWNIRAAALLAPLGSVLSSTSQIDKKVPVLIVSAEFDDILPHRYHAQQLQRIAPHAIHQTAPGAGHFSFIAPINPGWQSQLGDVAIDPPGFDRTQFNQQLAIELVEWFNTTLAN